MRAPTGTAIHKMQGKAAATGCACNSEPETWHIQTPCDLLPFPLVKLQVHLGSWGHQHQTPCDQTAGATCDLGDVLCQELDFWDPRGSLLTQTIRWFSSTTSFWQIHYLLSQKKLKPWGDWQHTLEIFKNWCAWSSINENRFSAWRAFGL